MSGRHKFSELEAKLAPERRARINRMTEALAEQIDRAQAASRPLSEALLQLLEQYPEGLTPKQIQEKLGHVYDKSNDPSVSDTLNALKKANRIFSKDRKYVLV
jgi:hypothetical protein